MKTNKTYRKIYKALILLIVSTVSKISSSQNTPQYSGFKQVTTQQPTTQENPYYYQKSAQENMQNTDNGTGTPNVNFSNNWTELSMEERNKAVMRMHGFTPPPTAEDIKQKQLLALNNPQVFKSELTEYEKLSLELVNDAYYDEGANRKNATYYTTPEFKKKEQPFLSAATTIKQMLAGKKPLSIKDTYFQMENAYGSAYVNYAEYSNQIRQSADFIKKWLVQHGYDINNSEDLHYGIQSFMKDTLSITIFNPDQKVKSRTQKHVPFKYDYADFEAVKDHRNFYVTKCLATGYGQCNSLPTVYLILAEALGVTCYLTFAPQHAFIKYPDHKGNIHNYEPTSNHHIEDKWYKDNLYISQSAIDNGIYLDTLNKKMIVANCLQDLALGYLVKLGLADGQFAIQCSNQTLQYFPRANNICSYFLKSEILSRIVERYMFTNKIQDIEQAIQLPQIQTYYKQLLENETIIKQLGYQAMPEQLYTDVMGIHTDKAKRQLDNNITGKQKKPLFLITK